MNNEKIEVKETKDNTVIVAETKEYTMTISEVENTIKNIEYQKESLIKQNNDIRDKYDKLVARENEFKSILATLKSKTGSTVPQPLE